jgi:hypothetical protein
VTACKRRLIAPRLDVVEELTGDEHGSDPLDAEGVADTGLLRQ